MEIIKSQDFPVQQLSNKYQFKEYNPPGLIILDNPLLAGGYYYKDKFYLNVCNWSNGDFKYGVENLTLHETIPGHRKLRARRKSRDLQALP